jgi:hypothetical protein
MCAELGVGCFVGLDDIKNAETMIAQVFRVTSFFFASKFAILSSFRGIFFCRLERKIKINKLVEMQAITF